MLQAHTDRVPHRLRTLLRPLGPRLALGKRRHLIVARESLDCLCRRLVRVLGGLACANSRQTVDGLLEQEVVVAPPGPEVVPERGVAGNVLEGVQAAQLLLGKACEVEQCARVHSFLRLVLRVRDHRGVHGVVHGLNSEDLLLLDVLGDHSEDLVDDDVRVANHQEEDADPFEVALGYEPGCDGDHDLVLVLGARVVDLQVQLVRKVAVVRLHAQDGGPHDCPQQVGAAEHGVVHKERREAIAWCVRRHQLQPEERQPEELLRTPRQHARQLEVALCGGISHDGPDGPRRSDRTKAGVVHLLPFAQVVRLVFGRTCVEEAPFLNGLRCVVVLQRFTKSGNVRAHVALAVGAGLPFDDPRLRPPEPLERLLGDVRGVPAKVSEVLLHCVDLFSPRSFLHDCLLAAHASEAGNGLHLVRVRHDFGDVRANERHVEVLFLAPMQSGLLLRRRR